MPKKTKEWRKTLSNVFNNDKTNKFLKRLSAKFDRDVTVNFKLIDNIDQKVKIEGEKIHIGKRHTFESAGEVVRYLERRFARGFKVINRSTKEVEEYGENITNFLKSEFEKGKPKEGHHQSTVRFFKDFYIDPIFDRVRKFSTKYANEIKTTRTQLIDPVVNAYKKSSEKKNMEKEFKELIKQGGDVSRFKFKSDLGIAIKNIRELSAWNKKLKRELPDELKRAKEAIDDIKERR